MFSKEVYVNRRAKLRASFDSGLLLFPGNNETPMNYMANTYRFRQDSTFLYFFGIDLPGLFAIIDVDSGDEILFGDDLDLEDIIWSGKQKSLKEYAHDSGIETHLAFREIYKSISTAIESGRSIHFLPQYRGDNKILVSDLIEVSPVQLNNRASLPFIKACVGLRAVKEPCEITEIEAACKVGYQMHLFAMINALEGKSESYLAGGMEGIANSYGGTIAFPIILSQRGEVLHNLHHNQSLSNGKLLLMDAGAESSMHYSCDFTRTIPVGHRFTQQQREIYEIVLQANNCAQELAKPGIRYLDVHLEAAKVIASGLKQLGIMKGNIDDAVNQGAHALFFPHGLGHLMGLDVHDMEDYGQIHVGYDDETRPVDQFGTAYLRFGRRLQKGFVLTVEPGIYFIPELIERWESQKMHTSFINYQALKKFFGFGGIRLEDDMVITENGSRLLGQRLPITIEELEKIGE